MRRSNAPLQFARDDGCLCLFAREGIEKRERNESTCRTRNDDHSTTVLGSWLIRKRFLCSTKVDQSLSSVRSQRQSGWATAEPGRARTCHRTIEAAGLQTADAGLRASADFLNLASSPIDEVINFAQRRTPKRCNIFTPDAYEHFIECANIARTEILKEEIDPIKRAVLLRLLAKQESKKAN